MSILRSKAVCAFLLHLTFVAPNPIPMTPLPDLTKQDLPGLLSRFYTEDIPDPVIGHFFTEVAKLDLDVHLPVIASFWEGILFGSGSYKGNPMVKHVNMHAQSAMAPEHFQRWLGLWEAGIRSHFEGPVAEEAVLRGKTIARVMEHKVIHS